MYYNVNTITYLFEISNYHIFTQYEFLILFLFSFFNYRKFRKKNENILKNIITFIIIMS